jgi:hypothetical protein
MYHTAAYQGMRSQLAHTVTATSVVGRIVEEPSWNQKKTVFHQYSRQRSLSQGMVQPFHVASRVRSTIGDRGSLYLSSQTNGRTREQSVLYHSCGELPFFECLMQFWPIRVPLSAGCLAPVNRESQ